MFRMDFRKDGGRFTSALYETISSEQGIQHSRHLLSRMF